MKDQTESTLRTLVAEKADYVRSLFQGGRLKMFLTQCNREVGSHVDAIGERGWTHVKDGDEYSPFEKGDYAVFTASGNSMSVQLAVSFTCDKMYIARYILEKDGWYDWEEYKVEYSVTDSKDKRKKVPSFEQALEQARQRARKGNSSVNGDSLNVCRGGKVYVKDLQKNSSEKSIVNTEVENNIGNGIGINIYSEDEMSTENNRCIEVFGVKSLENMKNKIIAVKSRKPFVQTGKVSPVTLTIRNVGSALIKFNEYPRIYLSNTEINIYFITYDGTDFVYCGRLSK